MISISCSSNCIINNSLIYIFISSAVFRSLKQLLVEISPLS
uniref:Uncharacterized protein n=1 Tax=Myoviridae sp. ctCop38 TaxID=2826632 RepID=A0A8S5MYA1_9CAUD|nr:MAG TPA: hypothetical protein [Myoviridae sp. ctCop38]